MFNKFIEGLVFGAGFTISFVVIWFLSFNFVTNTMFESQMEENVSKKETEIPHRAIPEGFKSELKKGMNDSKPFHKLSMEEKIERASYIAMVRYEETSGPKVRAVIDQFLKKDPCSEIHYDVGDEYTPGNFYPESDIKRGDGLVVFFTGSPATMKFSTSYDDSRVSGLANIPIELLKKKIKNSTDT